MLSEFTNLFAELKATELAVWEYSELETNQDLYFYLII